MRRVEVRSKHGNSFIALEDMEAEGYGDLLPIFSVEGKTEGL